MKDEYDFSNATLVPPIHLAPPVLDVWLKEAKTRGQTLSGLVDELLENDVRELRESEKARGGKRGALIP
jgi:hypothetical protein